ncbi:1-acyl-sn-glycerol-3-phosphate acyltransferase [Salinisphaera sp. USBA-960]|uniref:lysophospholipid acyltransferase family protein n=1 Tax=Salinisphaera orenii TaxID=856731 RepID=UPI000DBE0519|nr:1-acyl-sn-glycerol-3-phosphate acyltransferase [Salifodinibacter halophilus]NNC26639.1 1-acyl-sn-glycerol-3-phosphate acyltransferase [Salifodinibacter halophilus]
MSFHLNHGPIALTIRAIWFTALVLFALALVPLVPIFGQRTADVARWWFGLALRALGVSLAVNGDIPAKPTVIVANHCSWLDILVLGHVFRASFISKEEVKRWPVAGRLARATGTLFLPRGAGQTQAIGEQIRATLAENRSVVLFPEATTARSPVPARFHARLFAAAIDEGFDVLPVAVRYTDDHTPADQHLAPVPWVDMPLWPNFVAVFRLKALRARVQICDTVTSMGLDRRGLAEASRQAIVYQQQRDSAPNRVNEPAATS